ncbi:hypothetical protein KPL70_021387 [Citrus sinensis]|nr:hypothetical protein KPL70_021387 [Citrus sinensis]
MLLAKKSTIATNNIEFLGMIIKDGHYQLGKHVAQELLHFPDQQLSKKQVQQFLGIINYICDFIPHVDHYTRHLSALLKKKPPEWNADHTTAVTTLKQIAQNPPPLKLITNGKRILQTDASDESWGAILLEESNSKEHFIAYASGQFSNTQKHYHSVFKEILASGVLEWVDLRHDFEAYRPVGGVRWLFWQRKFVLHLEFGLELSRLWANWDLEEKDLVANWKREGYTHLHLGGVRLILTLHGRKGLPITARIALLDTRFKQYQHAVIGTVLTTLHASSVLLTFYPNFNLSLEDPNLPTTIKVQIQVQGAKQTPTSKIATLHHQIVYRLQNHALDLPTPHTTSDALMILADTDTIPTIIQIPKQIQKQELLTLMPLKWLTNYEHFHQNSKLVQTTEATFERRQNGQVKLSFQTPNQVSETPRLSYTTMIIAVQTSQEKNLPIHGFSFEGYPVYPDKLNGHFLWDVPKAHMCNPDCPCLDDTDIDDDLEEATTEPVPQMPLSVIDHSTKPSLASWFTFDDIPRHKWPSRLQEFAVWIDLQGTKPNTHPENVLCAFMARSTGSLRDWLESLGEYRQLQSMQSPIGTTLNIIHEQFIEELSSIIGIVVEALGSSVLDAISMLVRSAYSDSESVEVLEWLLVNLLEVEGLVEDVRIQRTSCKQEVEPWMEVLGLVEVVEEKVYKMSWEKKMMVGIVSVSARIIRAFDVEIKKDYSEFLRLSPMLGTVGSDTTYAPFYTPSRPQPPVYNQFFGFSHLQPTPHPKPSSPKKLKSKVKISEPQSKASHISKLSAKMRRNVFVQPRRKNVIGLCKRRGFQPRGKSKLHPGGDGPFQILDHINDNTYKVDLPGDDLRANPLQEEGNDKIETRLTQARGMRHI